MMELAWQEFQETLMWSRSVRCSIHGHEQPLVWRIYNHDAAAVPVFMFALIISSDVLIIVNLTNSPSHLPVLFIDCKIAIDCIADPQLLFVEKWIQVWVH